jgi:hypothetical protein
MRSFLPAKWILGSLFCVSSLVIFLLITKTSSAYATTTLSIAALKSTVISKPKIQTSPTTTIYVLPSSSYLDPSSIIAYIAIGVQIITLVFIIKYVRDTAAMARATQKSSEAAENTLREMKKTREEENAPYVVVSTENIQNSPFIYLVFQNIGKNVARDVKMDFSPPLESSLYRNEALDSSPLIKNGFHSIVPNEKISIPLDSAISYFEQNRPLEYTVNVIYFGDIPEFKGELTYVLGLTHYKYILANDKNNLSAINNNLEIMSSNFYQYMSDIKAVIYKSNEISNSLNSIASHYNGSLTDDIDTNVITRKLKEFSLIWLLEYGKEEEKFKKTFLFSLRSRCLHLSQELITYVASNKEEEWTQAVKGVIQKLSNLGNMQLVLDGYVIAQSMQGKPIENFNHLGDDIIDDIKKIVGLIEKGNENQPDKISEEEKLDGLGIPIYQNKGIPD